MYITKYFVFPLVVSLCLISFSIFAATDISGVWQHADKPVLLHIDQVTGVISVKRHDDNARATGLTVIKNLSQSPDRENLWQGDMYNGYIKAYVKVHITLSEHGTIVIHDTQGEKVLTLYRP